MQRNQISWLRSLPNERRFPEGIQSVRSVQSATPNLFGEGEYFAFNYLEPPYNILLYSIDLSILIYTLDCLKLI